MLHLLHLLSDSLPLDELFNLHLLHLLCDICVAQTVTNLDICTYYTYFCRFVLTFDGSFEFCTYFTYFS